MTKLDPIRCLLVAALCVPLFAHALDEAPLTMIYEATAPAAPNIPNQQPVRTAAAPRFAPNCRTPVRAIDDLRSNKLSVGGLVLILEANPAAVPLGAVSVRSGDGQQWLKGALSSLRAPGTAQQRASAPAQGVDVGLRLAHTWTAGMNMHSHVVLQASYPGEGGTVVVRRYHGFATKLNGWGANSEFMTTLNMGMQDALQQFANDLQRACRGEAV
jgi:hypothetical protein